MADRLPNVDASRDSDIPDRTGGVTFSRRAGEGPVESC